MSPRFQFVKDEIEWAGAPLHKIRIDGRLVIKPYIEGSTTRMTLWKRKVAYELAKNNLDGKISPQDVKLPHLKPVNIKSALSDFSTWSRRNRRQGGQGKRRRVDSEQQKGDGAGWRRRVELGPPPARFRTMHRR